MKQFFKYFFASFLAIIIGGMILFAAFFAIVNMITSSFSKISEVEKIEPEYSNSKEVLVLDINQNINELKQTNILNFITTGKDNGVGLYDIIDAIKEAKDDKSIKGLYIKANGTPNGFATLQQLRDAVKDFKSSGKFVYAFGESMSQMDYFVASVADSIFVHPMGGVEIKGLASTISFYKGALDKLEVKPEIFYCGEFKSATEPFRLEKMSEPNRKQLNAIQADYWAVIVNAIAERTKADSATIHNWANNYTIDNVTTAKELNVIDGVKYKDELEALILNATGKNATDKLPLVSISDYYKSKKSSGNSDQIAILVAEGNIIDGSSNNTTPEIAADDIIKEIRKIRDNDHIKAVVIRVNSPGGSALASENIHRELLALKAKKPYVVAMGDYAASGGYYIAAGADSIYAMPSTLTGSIGVFGMMFSTRDLMKNKLGITTDVEKNAPYADFPTLSRPFTERERVIIQSGVDTVYALFKRRVAEGRKMDVAYVDSVGQGRIWSGTKALELGLVDALGGLDRALAGASKLANLNNYKVVLYPQQKDQFSQIFKMINANSVSETLLKETELYQELGPAFHFYQLMKNSNNNRLNIYALMPFAMKIQ